MSDVPIAVSRLGEGDSREAQNARAVNWLLAQPGGSIVVLTPQKTVESAILRGLIASPQAQHYVWRGFRGASFDGQRVLSAWPDRAALNLVWNVAADAIAVIEWNTEQTAAWIRDANPIQLVPAGIIEPSPRARAELDPLPNGVDEILESVAAWAAGYDSGLKWDEKDKLKADMMNRPDRWAPISVGQVRAKCRALGMRGADVDTITGFLQRRKDGHRFNVRAPYRTFSFN